MKAEPPWPPIIGENQKKIEDERTCEQCGYEGLGFIMEYYPHGGYTPLEICPECKCGF